MCNIETMFWQQLTVQSLLIFVIQLSLANLTLSHSANPHQSPTSVDGRWLQIKPATQAAAPVHVQDKGGAREVQERPALV
jgi:hypothetical protein